MLVFKYDPQTLHGGFKIFFIQISPPGGFRGVIQVAELFDSSGNLRINLN